MGNHKGIIIADIHWGRIDDTRLFNELNEVFLYEVENQEKLDFLIIDGDYFDKKMFLKDRASELSFKFMMRLCDILRKRRTKIRIVYGTELHESSQYNIFSLLDTDPDLDFKVIYTATEEELFPNFHVLYIPEEFVRDKKEYYKKFLSQKHKYDYIFGHGIIKEVMTEASRNSDEKSNRVRVPIFTTAELLSMCKGLVFFGHYHIQTNIMDKIFYVSSYTRWQFGEEPPKGFFITEYNEKKNRYSALFIENYLAQTYKTFLYGFDSKIFRSQEEFVKEIGRIDTLIRHSFFDHIRLIINIPESFPNPNFIIDFLREKYNFNNRVKVMVTNGAIDKQLKLSKEHVKDVMDRYGYIFDKSMPLEEKLSYFIETKYGKNISIDKIKRYLYEDILYENNFEGSEADA